VRLARRILITAVVTVALVFVGVNWIAPVALSFYAAKKAPAVASIVPTELKDQSVSQAPGTKLSYFGNEFEVPWIDLDETQTRLYPKDKPEKTKVQMRFRSGLRLLVSVAPPRIWANQLARELNTSPQDLESALGSGTMKSDYSFAKALYEFSPDNMNYWTMSQGASNRNELLLTVKCIALPKSAETGIFNVQNGTYKGFQEGNPRVRQDQIVVDLYSDDGGVEMIFFQSDYQNFRGVTQPEINRIVQSLHKITQEERPIPNVAPKTPNLRGTADSKVRTENCPPNC
jgi:hypothetical protein